MDLLRWLRALFAWTFVRHDGPWTYFENRVTGQRRCRWDGSVYRYVDYDFMRPGDVVEGPFGREVISDNASFSPALRG
jgi:hypothetical protein